ncbi:MAG: PilZ domain-containing protein [Parvularculaceae bacterium]|nr:PilZ domain-containing protein [Parvularculaceae bacterium]
MLTRKNQKSELRRYRRVPLDLPARVIVNGIDEYDGRLVNISPGDLAVRVNANVVVGDAAVLYISGLDVIEGRIARVTPDGFALSFLLSRRRRALLTEQLMLQVNPAFAEGLSDRRTAPRHPSHDHRMVCRLPSGGSLFVRVIDMSVDGVSVESPRKPAVGTQIHVGRMRAIVMRHTPRGFVAVYEKGETREGGEQPPAAKLHAV